MKVFHRIAGVREYLEDLRPNNRIGLVPTMGMLHPGHITLIEACKQTCDITVATIFVNPLQFNNKEDLEKYPRDTDRDLDLLQKSGCDVVFVPEASEVYPKEAKTGFSFGPLESVMEGAFRPGHFSGMAVVVSKLFNIIQPHQAFFGQKDLQQFAIIKQFVDDLNFPIELIRHPIIREESGLALSSRNARLTSEQREIAPALFKALTLVSQKLAELSVEDSIKAGQDYLSGFADIQPEYLEVVDAQTLQSIDSLDGHKEVAVCIAAYLGGVRLIDNVVLRTD